MGARLSMFLGGPAVSRGCVARLNTSPDWQCKEIQVTKFMCVVLIACLPTVGMCKDSIKSIQGGGYVVIDGFSEYSIGRWRFVSDQVMGGVSSGTLNFELDDEDVVAHMTGSVSTENNGGFIQFRRNISLPESIIGIKLRVRGNNQKYFVHIRTRGTVLPWQYYSSEFAATDDWADVFLPLANFSRSSRWLNRTLEAASARSLGIVAYGRDHQADIQVSTIEGY